MKLEDPRRSTRIGRAALALLAASGIEATAQSRYATSVVSFQQGTGGGIFVTDNILGGPQGGGLGNGSLHVLSLGEGGRVTLGFAVTLTDGPGADFTVFENGFVIGGGGSVFAEVGRVEVSTDGIVFARFPSHFTPPGALTNWGSFAGLAGGMPCMANVVTNGIDPFDPVESGGDSFDLAELALDPAVLSGQVDLGEIHFVRLADVISGELDSDGDPILDAGGADFDAVAVIHHTGNQTPSAPRLDLWRDAAGFVHVDVSDPDGFGDLDPAEFRISRNLVELPFAKLRDAFELESVSPDGWRIVSTAPIAQLQLDEVLAVTIEDASGLASSDQISLRH